MTPGTPSPADVAARKVARRERVFDYTAADGTPQVARARALGSADGATKDLTSALDALRRDSFERYIDLNVERLERAWQRCFSAMQQLRDLLDDAPVPPPQEGGLTPTTPPANAAGTST